jgi:hypothetical protein
MELNFSFAGTIDPVALYAAILSTIIAVGEIIKWRARNRIEVKCNPNIIIVPSNDNNKYVCTNVVNKGEFPTTITHLLMFYWENRIDKMLKRKRQSFVINTNQVPKIVNPGEQWMGQALQDDKIEKMALDGYLYFGVIHSMGKKEILRRVKIMKEQTKEAS